MYINEDFAIYSICPYFLSILLTYCPITLFQMLVFKFSGNQLCIIKIHVSIFFHPKIYAPAVLYEASQIQSQHYTILIFAPYLCTSLMETTCLICVQAGAILLTFLFKILLEALLVCLKCVKQQQSFKI